MEKKRNITYDYLRGFAMLFIVFGHLYFYSNRSEGSLVFNICDTIELPVFMYISGLLAHVSVDRYGFRKLIWTKVIRLLFPLLSFYVIWGLWDSSYWSQFWLKEHKNGYWFMLVLFELMVTLSFVKKCSTQFKIKSIYVYTAVYAIASLAFVMIPKDGLVNHLLCVKLYWHFYPFFMMGYYSYRLDRFLQLKYAPLYLFLYLLVFFYFQNNLWKVGINMVCNLFSLLFLLSVFSTSFKPLKSVFATVGVNSLQVYMLHFFLVFPLLTVLPVVENRWLEFPYYVAVASAIIFVTICISKLLMKSSWLAMFLFGVRRK
jgi:fucose 4-O-acetylase-like acetyltransferase